MQDSRRKSVTFTPETKQEDGFSALSFSRQQFQSQSSDQSQSESPQPDSAPTQSEKKIKRLKTKQSREVEDADYPSSKPAIVSESPALGIASTATETAGARSSPEAQPSRDTDDANGSKKKKAKDKSSESRAITSSIEYLQQFSQDRALWRFNKKKQTILLKNLFDIHLIPLQHDQVIVEYISGLQGEAARQRLIETATSILQSIAEKQDDFEMQSMESEEARRRAYADALKKEIMRYERSNVEPNESDEKQLADTKREIERGQRAEAVLFKLLEKELYPGKYAQPNATPQQLAKTSNLNGNGKHEAPVSTATSVSQAASVQRIIATEGTRATGLKRKKRKTRTSSPNEDSSSSSSDTNSDTNTNTPPSDGPRSVREALAATSALDSWASSKKSSIPSATGKGKKTLFDDDLLEKKFPQEKTYHEMAPKRKVGEEKKGRGFHYTHGALADESGSESE